MSRLLATLALRLLLAGGVAWGLGRVFGPVGVVTAAPLFGVLLARPLIDLVSKLRHALRDHAQAPVAGRHYAHRGIALDIVEDERHRRWIRVDDVRKLIVALPRDALLRRQYPQDLRDDGAGGGLRLRAEALVAYLGKATDPSSLRLRRWLEREVVFPAAARRQRLGIRDEPADDDADAPGAGPGAA